MPETAIPNDILFLWDRVGSLPTSEARDLLEQMLQLYPVDSLVRLKVAVAFRLIGDEVRYALELAKLLAIDPAYPPASRSLAMYLHRQGEIVLARCVLDRGWKRYARDVSRRDRETVRADYYRVIEDHASSDDQRGPSSDQRGVIPGP